ncbi:MAG: ATP-dependent Clp protease adaptor ClpS [Phycisphaerales bacterium]
MTESQPDNPQAPRTTTAVAPAARPATKPKLPWLWNVVLLDDQHHTYAYVIKMVRDLFGMTTEQAQKLAESVDRDGRAVCMTTHREHAELKCEQVFGFGKDPLIAECAGPMSCVIEPAVESGDDQSK